MAAPTPYEEMATAVEIFITDIFKKTLRKNIRISENKALEAHKCVKPILGSESEKYAFDPSTVAASLFDSVKNSIQKEVEKILLQIELTNFSLAVLSFSGYKPPTREED